MRKPPLLPAISVPGTGDSGSVIGPRRVFGCPTTQERKHKGSGLAIIHCPVLPASIIGSACQHAPPEGNKGESCLRRPSGGHVPATWIPCHRVSPSDATNLPRRRTCTHPQGLKLHRLLRAIHVNNSIPQSCHGPLAAPRQDF